MSIWSPEEVRGPAAPAARWPEEVEVEAEEEEEEGVEEEEGEGEAACSVEGGGEAADRSEETRRAARGRFESV